MPVIPALWEAVVGKSPDVRSSRLAWPTWWNLVSTKNTKISWVWWQMPVIPATWQAKAGESLELRRQGLQLAEITPLHSSLGNTARLSLKGQQTTKQKTPKASHYHISKYTFYMCYMLQSYDNPSSILLASKQTHRRMERNTEPKNKTMYLQTYDFWQRCQDYELRKQESL